MTVLIRWNVVNKNTKKKKITSLLTLCVHVLSTYFIRQIHRTNAHHRTYTFQANASVLQFTIIIHRHTNTIAFIVLDVVYIVRSSVTLNTCHLTILCSLLFRFTGLFFKRNRVVFVFMNVPQISIKNTGKSFFHVCKLNFNFN